jgi:hypothetical protein
MTFVAWQDLKKTARTLGALEERSNELLSSVEIAKKLCTAGILRAQTVRAKRRPPYHQASTIFLRIALSATRAWAQNIEHYEGILIDASGSISRGGASSELFHEYLTSTKKLLITEPANSRVWASGPLDRLLRRRPRGRKGLDSRCAPHLH